MKKSTKMRIDRLGREGEALLHCMKRLLPCNDGLNYNLTVGNTCLTNRLGEIMDEIHNLKKGE